MVAILWMAMLMVGCHDFVSDKDKEEPKVEIEIPDSEPVLYLILKHDTVEETLTLYNYKTGREHYYKYAFSTDFSDKYGNYKSVSEFLEGCVVTIASPDEHGYLTKVQMSDEVWEYENIRRFSIEEREGIFTIAGTKYSILDGVVAFSGGKEITLDEISENDVLKVTGQGKKILSVVVTTGHGTLSLSNTDLFEGSLMQLNTDRFIMISKNMEVEIPEGIYTLMVANNGWGGNCQIEVIRGEKTTVDLDTLKGEGKKKGLITFSITPLEAKVYLDHKEIDVSEPVEITYGTHTLEIEAEGHESWKKYLTVNSETATLVIKLVAEETADTEEKTDTEETTETEEATETEEGTETEKSTQSEHDKRQEELEELEEEIDEIIKDVFGGLL